MSHIIEYDIVLGKGMLSYTRCKLGIIVGSNLCRACRNFIDKATENHIDIDAGVVVAHNMVECNIDAE